jgi:hypothetical protein
MARELNPFSHSQMNIMKQGLCYIDVSERWVNKTVSFVKQGNE